MWILSCVFFYVKQRIVKEKEMASTIVINSDPIRRVKVIGYIVDDNSISRVVEYEYDHPNAPGEARIRQIELETVTRKEMDLHNKGEQALLHHKSQSVCEQVYGKLFDDWYEKRFSEPEKNTK